MNQEGEKRSIQKSSLALHWNLFVAFFRSGIVSFGGGPSGIPLIETEVVKRYHWMSLEEFGDMVALANALPGPINTKLAGYVGWRIKGLSGLLVALAAVVLPTVVLMIALLGVLARFQDQRWVRGMTQAVLPVVGVLMAQLTWSFMKNAKKGLGWIISLILVGMSFVLMEVLHVHPAILIALTLLLVLLKPSKKAGEHQ
ncbi:chromate transporter [Sporolactobacillus shoreicorticis]|uniref:Chromate transporter n=1 Tax=Sporolactobacillus shoreicorticis TaxID=1923877 RepID=A0ABW5S3A7_9BACL|nr:chromate transporter [Sporolactobacillus shoreicorticis]MCO7127684.1 chromate transporter [Sporolactobacillus shoreicorticis]